MKSRATGFTALRSALAFVLSFVLVAGAGNVAFAQAANAAIAGVILDPAGKPAAGFKVVLHDAASNKDFVSDPTDAQGNYSARVPVGGQYKLTGVIASDGVTKLPVQDVPPVNVLTAGTTRLNVRFTAAVPATTAVASNSGTTEKEDEKKGATPWYKRPGPIVGMVLGGLVIVALAAGGGGGDSNGNVSPSVPNP